MSTRGKPLALTLLVSVTLVLCAARCTSGEDSRATSLVIKDSPEALLADATSILRVEIVQNRPLTWTEDDEETACGFSHESKVLDHLRGPGHEVFLANEALSPGQQYLVAILDLEGKLPPTTASSIDERDRPLLQCREQLPRYVLGWARFEDAGSDRLLVDSSAIVPETVRRSAVDGAVLLDDLRDFVRTMSP